MNNQKDSPHEFYRQFMKPDDLIFDIGANVGGKSEIFLALGARVVAVEPQKHCVDHLRSRLLPHQKLTVVEKALGEKEGEAIMYVNDAHVLSTISPEWVKHMEASGRFKGYPWKRRTIVPLTTLDDLLAQYGVPVFCKIDVEGYELNVLRGLSQALPALCIEFAIETISQTKSCMEYLQTLGNYEWNYCFGDDMRFALDDWVESDVLLGKIKQLAHPLAWGDVYARLRKSSVKASIGDFGT